MLVTTEQERNKGNITNKETIMMDALKDNKEWIELKATLQFVEDNILRTIDFDGWVMN